MARDGRRDPVEVASDEGADLYDVATWEPRTWLDRLSVGCYRWLGRIARVVVVLLALAILVVQFAFAGLAAVANPVVGTFILLSVVPALLLAAYVWRMDVTMREPLGLLVGTFLLGILFASFAAVLNTLARPYFTGLWFAGMALFFYLIVGPVEETVKWLAIRLYAYRDDRFHAVVDGAVYGAMAGLGFATIENTLYIGQEYLKALEAGAAASPIFGAALPTAAVRSFAGPGHVIYSAFAGYYLGLAKFNPENAGPIALKGILIAAFIHGTYNTVVTYLFPVARAMGVAIPSAVLFLGFVVIYDGVLGYALLRKLSRYRRAFRASDASALDEPDGDGGESDGEDGAAPAADDGTREADTPAAGGESSEEGTAAARGGAFGADEPDGATDDGTDADDEPAVIRPDEGETDPGPGDETSVVGGDDTETGDGAFVWAGDEGGSRDDEGREGAGEEWGEPTAGGVRDEADDDGDDTADGEGEAREDDADEEDEESEETSFEDLFTSAEESEDDGPF